MFTGLVQERGAVVAASHADGGLWLSVQSRSLASCAAGDSVAVNGVCLTVASLDGQAASFVVMPETERRSSFAALSSGDEVNIELPLRAGDRLAGHIVQGHVDGLGEVLTVTDEGSARVVEIAAEPSVLRYLVAKGSVAVDGVSLTIAALASESFTVSLIPETCGRTTLGDVGIGQMVNLEVDVIAKYVERLVAAR